MVSIWPAYLTEKQNPPPIFGGFVNLWPSWAQGSRLLEKKCEVPPLWELLPQPIAKPKRGKNPVAETDLSEERRNFDHAPDQTPGPDPAGFFVCEYRFHVQFSCPSRDRNAPPTHDSQTNPMHATQKARSTRLDSEHQFYTPLYGLEWRYQETDKC